MVKGKGLQTGVLSKDEIGNICTEAFSDIRVDGKKVLFLLPDHTRTAPLDVLFPVLYSLLAERVELLDFIIALGTHPPMSQEMIYQQLGISVNEAQTTFKKARFFNHQWKDPDQLVHIGTIDKEEIEEISGGRWIEPVKVNINKLVLDYDLLVILGPTFPHEVVGFSGGNKYLFPGIAGQDIIDMFHWLGALITSPAIIGTKYTPVREVVDRSASFLPIERYCLSLVVKGNDLAGLYAGPPEEAFAAAAELSEQLHIIYKDKPYQSVLARAPEMYDDLWTGGKCMYKMEPVVADGGELIIYAPHIEQISVTHGVYIKEIGYHVRDYFIDNMDQFPHIPKGVMAHSTHVRGIGTYENGLEQPRISVTLATRIPKEICERVNLGYRDPDTIHPEDWRDHEEDGFLYVPKAGEMLYRLKEDPFRVQRRR